MTTERSLRDITERDHTERSQREIHRDHKQKADCEQGACVPVIEPEVFVTDLCTAQRVWCSLVELSEQQGDSNEGLFGQNVTKSWGLIAQGKI